MTYSFEFTQVSNAAQARSVVSAARFPPKGTRGFGSPFTQVAWGLSVAEYLQQANDSVLVLTQVETREAFDKIEEICSVEGLGDFHLALGCAVLILIFCIDGVFIGPYDLSLSLGFPPPNPDPHPKVEEAIQTILQTAHKAGKKW